MRSLSLSLSLSLSPSSCLFLSALLPDPGMTIDLSIATQKDWTEEENQPDSGRRRWIELGEGGRVKVGNEEGVYGRKERDKKRHAARPSFTFVDVDTQRLWVHLDISSVF